MRGGTVKEDLKAQVRYKFRTWKRCFVIFFALFIISFIVGTILYKSSYLEFLSPVFGYMLSAFDTGFRAAFSVFLLSAVPFFILYIAGPTIYAPLTSALTICVSGAFSGAQVSHFMREKRVALCLFEIIFSSATVYFLILWAVMVTLSSMRIFTDEVKDNRELFTGRLFRADKFCGIFNLRYIFTYTCFFVFMSLGVVLVSAIRAFTASLF